MRSLWLAIAFVVLSANAMAQLPRTNATDNGVLVEFQPIVGSGVTPWIRIAQYGIVQHSLVVTPIGTAPSQLSVNLECSRDGSTVESVLGTMSSQTGGAVQVGATTACPYIRGNVSSPDVGQSVILAYVGVAPTAYIGMAPASSTSTPSGAISTPTAAPSVINKLLLACNALRRTFCQ